MALFKYLPKRLVTRIREDQHSIDNSFAAKNKQCDTYCIIGSSAEFEYWRQNGLKEKQIINWTKMLDCNEEMLLRYLSYCRFEMVDLGVEKSKPIDNVLNWFYKILKRTGGYPKPKGYKSFEEKRLEEERDALAEQELIAKEKEKIYEAKIKAERDAEFFEMLVNPDHSMYKKCFDNLNDLVKNRKRNKSFEIAMRKVLDDIMDGG